MEKLNTAVSRELRGQTVLRLRTLPLGITRSEECVLDPIMIKMHPVFFF